MKFITIFLLLFVAINKSHAKCGNNSNNFCNVKVVSVYDGDTFFIDLPKVHPLFGKRLGVRVWGVNTPEMRSRSIYEKAMAKKAKKYTQDFIERSKKVTLINCKKGKYFRIVCAVLGDNEDLATHLIKNGLGVEYMK